MIYFSDDALQIRTIVETDPKILCQEELAQGWHATEDKYWARVADNTSGKCVSLVAEYRGKVAGYINVYKNPSWGSFANMGYCEIVDFGVLEKYRCLGIGTKLMDTAERIASEYADTVCLAVGLHSGYGRAQKMYCKRGYILDSKGVWYKDKIAQPYETYYNDDDLNLYFSKKLNRQS